MMMKRIRDFWINRIESSVSDFVDNITNWEEFFNYILVVTIDSSHVLTELPAIQKGIEKGFDITSFDSKIILTNETIRKMNKEFSLFNGFDEIYCFPERPKALSPRKAFLTGPIKIENKIPDDLEQWMLNNNCLLGLGDGIGLNYITTEKAIAEIFESNNEAMKSTMPR